MSDDYRLILACRLSGQISDAVWAEHLKDELFRLWLDRTTAKTPRVGETRDE